MIERRVGIELVTERRTRGGMFYNVNVLGTLCVRNVRGGRQKREEPK